MTDKDWGRSPPQEKEPPPERWGRSPESKGMNRADKIAAFADGVDRLASRVDALSARVDATAARVDAGGSHNRAMSRAALEAKIKSGDYVKVGEERSGWQSVWSNGQRYEVKILDK